MLRDARREAHDLGPLPCVRQGGSLRGSAVASGSPAVEWRVETVQAPPEPAAPQPVATREPRTPAERAREWRRANPESVRASAKKYRESHRDQKREADRQYYASHREQRVAANRERRARRKAAREAAA